MLMQAQPDRTQVSITQLADKILHSRRISRQDRSQLMHLLSRTGLGEREQNVVDRLYQELHMGLIRVVD